MPEDWARLASYIIALIWGISFLTVPPSSYHDLLSSTILIGWMSCTVIGAVMAIIGVVTGIDIKLELPGIYLILVGPLLYYMAQIYFAIGHFQDRFALSMFVLWHLSLMLPRIVGLEAAARRGKRAKKASDPYGA